MLTTAPRLHIRRPSPTTTEFTVSTLPPQTLPLRLLLAVVNTARLLLGLLLLLLLYAKWTLSPYTTASPATAPVRPSEAVSLDFVLYLFHLSLTSPPGRFAGRLASATPFWALLPASLFLLYATVQRIHARESLLVLRGLGIQTSSSGATILGGPATRFIPTEKIQDVLINEAFRGFEVRYYLVVVVEGEEEVVVVFPKLLPRRDVVEKVWRGVRGCLFEARQRNMGRNGKSNTL
ncbi:phosphatidylinositol N-acetylglucosaminyltransferase [Truncatella angustata]|uniref:Phosphatidylinositol N-acetylglucosaminyltransferase n=1 Tax=Truncatella angustata TaxID=152316 RepID=A0A9P8URR3_9PEZI|nr:phosphatidylinositol N-acetylglucosaminyltransferase [Truncatella angustata]KAH6656835.1 phosphatidylinositol N-acetylglucosaminyltransferase [Truncatella angustata]